MLQHITGVGRIEGAPLASLERQCQRVALPPLHQVRFTSQPDLFPCFAQLILITLDAQDSPTRPDDAGHSAGELTQPAADIQHRFGAG